MVLGRAGGNLPEEVAGLDREGLGHLPEGGKVRLAPAVLDVLPGTGGDTGGG